jgi:hypothetical protein
MALDPKEAELRLRAEAEGIALRTADAEEPRFVFDLKAGAIVTAAEAGIARQLLLLAEAICAQDHGEARELARLVARRDALEDEDSITVVVWQAAARAHATAPDAYDPKHWVPFAEWVADQFLLEDAIARLKEGVPI